MFYEAIRIRYEPSFRRLLSLAMSRARACSFFLPMAGTIASALT
jgi:hypothetical protein